MQHVLLIFTGAFDDLSMSAAVSIAKVLKLNIGKAASYDCTSLSGLLVLLLTILIVG